jgi:hypothetical protein
MGAPKKSAVKKPKQKKPNVSSLKWNNTTNRGQAILWEGSHNYDYGLFAFTPVGEFRLINDDKKLSAFLVKQKNPVVNVSLKSVPKIYGLFGWEYKTVAEIDV